jgi:hypothetical protein
LIRKNSFDEKLIRRQHQLPHPTWLFLRPGSAGGAVSPSPSLKQLPFVVDLSGARLLPIQGGVFFRGKNNGHAFPQSQLTLEHTGKQAVLMIVETALLLRGEEIVAVPFMLCRPGHGIAPQKKRHGPFEGPHPQPVLHRPHTHFPVLRLSGLVKVPVIHQGLSFEFHRRAAPQQAVLDVGGVFPLLHPHALFEQRIGQGITPHRLGPLEMKAFDLQVPSWRNESAPPPVCGQRIGSTQIPHAFIEPVHEHGAFDRRPERRHQQRVISSGGRAGQRPAGIAA